MHERALVSQVALDLTAVTGDRKVRRVILAVGPETPHEVVEEAWRSTTAGTSAAGASLSCVTREHVLWCLGCGAEYPGGKLTVCPECGGNGLIIDAAPEVALDGWDVEDSA